MDERKTNKKTSKKSSKKRHKKTSKKSSKKRHKNNYAYVFLVMIGDAYVPLALTAAHSVRLTKPKADIVCMITHDVSVDGRKLLKKVFDKVIEVDYLEFETARINFEKKRKIYESWISKSYTKWRCLGLTQYKKVCFIDADMIMVENCDEIFERKPKSVGLFVNPFAYGGKGKIPKHSMKNITPNDVRKTLPRLSVVSAAFLVLTPDKKDLKEYIEYMKQNEPYGFPKVAMGQDEQSITYFQSIVKNRDWGQLDYQYNGILWHLNNVYRIMRDKYVHPKVIHYISDQKPHNIPRFEWPDLDIWWQYAQDLVATGEVPGSIFGKDIEKNPQRKCPFCSIAVKQIKDYKVHSIRHRFLTNGKVSCVSYT